MPQGATGLGGAGIAVVLVVGLLIVFVRPYWGFLFANFVCLAVPYSVLAYTRVSGLGPFFNLTDACLLLSLLAFVLDRERSLTLPKPVLFLSLVLLTGLLNSGLSFGFNYSVLRAFRWAMSLPILFFLTASMVRGEERVRLLLLVTIAASVVAECQHFVGVLSTNITFDDVALVRSYDFAFTGTESWLLAGPYLWLGQILHPLLQVSIGLLFLMGIVANQTRAVAVAFIAGLGVFYFWFLKGPNSFRSKRLKGLLGVLLVGVVFGSMSKFTIIARGFGDRLSDTARYMNRTVETGVETRLLAAKIELNDWLAGNILIGRGLSYFGIHVKGRVIGKEEAYQKALVGATGIAWGHLGYITYLSQLGLIGFLVYGFYLPLAVIRRSRSLMQQSHLASPTVHLALLTGACFMIQPVIFLFTGSYLAKSFFPGILAGAVWGITTNAIDTDPTHMVPENNHIAL